MCHAVFSAAPAHRTEEVEVKLKEETGWFSRLVQVLWIIWYEALNGHKYCKLYSSHRVFVCLHCDSF